MKHLVIKSESYQYIEKSFKEWLETLGYAWQTVYTLPTHIRELFHYLEQQGSTQITQLEVSQIKAYYEQLKIRSNQKHGGALSNTTLNKHLQALYKFAEYLRQSGRLTLPYLGIDWENDQAEAVEWLSQEEIKSLYQSTYIYPELSKHSSIKHHLEAYAMRDRAILTIFYGCGLRRNEGYHLDLSDIDFDRQILQVRKGKNYKARFVPFNKTSSKYLQDYVYDARPILTKDNLQNALFISQRGVRMQSQSIALRLKILQQRSENLELQEKNVRLHVLRHSIATHLLQNGMSLENISRFLGHTSLESTQVYTHLVESREITLPNGEMSEGQRGSKPYKNIPKYETIQLHEDESI